VFPITVLALANIVAASPASPLPWFEFDDYPMDAVRFETEGMSEVELLVAPDGKPVSCAISHSSGEKTLDRRACFVAMKRARFNPARDKALQPVYGTFRSQIEWRLDPEKWRQVGPAPQRQITLSRLPAGMQAPFYLEYALMVDEAGRTTNCAPSIPDHAAVTKATCAMLEKDMPAMPVVGPRGPVAAVRSVWVVYSI
jgi:TonB family protein